MSMPTIKPSAFDRASEKAQTEGLIMPENGEFPCPIDGLRVFGDRCRPIVDDIMSARNCACGIETAHISRNQDAPGKITIIHATLATKSTFWLQFSLVPK